MTPTARQQACEMTEATERTLAATFGWATAEERLFRECPTAFWLAPDGDGVLPPPSGPVMPAPHMAPIDGVPDEPVVVAGMAIGVFRAMLAAGPIFDATAVILQQGELDRFWWTPVLRALASLMAFPLTITFGALLAAIPVLAGVLALGWAGKSFAVIRTPGAWAAIGGVMGAAIATLTEAGGPLGLALIATSIACAIIARGGVAWVDPEPA